MMQQLAIQTVCLISSISPLQPTILHCLATRLLDTSSFHSLCKQRKQIKLIYILDALDDLLTNIQGGLRGGLDFLSVPSGSGAAKAKRAEDIPGAASKFFFLLSL
jgi:hypothetical protein